MTAELRKEIRKLQNIKDRKSESTVNKLFGKYNIKIGRLTLVIEELKQRVLAKSEE